MIQDTFDENLMNTLFYFKESHQNYEDSIGSIKKMDINIKDKLSVIKVYISKFMSSVSSKEDIRFIKTVVIEKEQRNNPYVRAVEFVKKMLENPEFRQNEQLKNALMEVQDVYDYIIIDCQPSLGLSTMNGLVASNSVIIPVQCEFFALEGISQLLNTIILVQSNMNPGLGIEGVLLTMLDGRTNIGLEVIEEVRKYFKNKVFNTIIPRLVRLVEAPSHGKPISDYDPTSRATLAYQNLAKEVISRNGK